MTIPLPRRQSLPHKPALPGRRNPRELAALPDIAAHKPLFDQYGLAWAWAEGLGDRQREWLALAYTELGYDKRVPPSRQGGYGSSGTIPEIVFLGGLLSRGLRHIQDYEFQSEALGGRRFPGGAVLDFLVYVNGLRVGVRVDSVFHASDFVFSGAAGVREDEGQRIRLLSNGSADRVVAVNRKSDGYPLEGTSDLLADADLARVMDVT